MKEEFQTWGDTYSIEFDIVVNQLPATEILNAFLFISTNGNDNGGGRIPSLNIRYDGQFVIKNTALTDYEGWLVKSDSLKSHCKQNLELLFQIYYKKWSSAICNMHRFDNNS